MLWGWLRIRATRFPTFPHALRAHGNDGKPLVGAIGGLADSGVQGTGESAAHADICPALGYGVVRLGKKDADEVVGGCADTGPMQGTGAVRLEKGIRLALAAPAGLRILRLLLWDGLGHRLPYRDPRRARIAG